MLYIFGRLFFPQMLHQEKKLRARMKLVAVVCGLVLVTAVGGLLLHLSQSQIRLEKVVKPFKTHTVPPNR